MVAEAVPNVASPAPHRRALVGRFLAWTDSLPWHGWWVYPALAVLLFAWSHGIVWATGAVPVGTIQPLLAVSVFYAPYILAALAYLNLTAGRSLEAFWPATGWPESQREAWRHALVSPSARYDAIAVALGLVAAVGGFLQAPADVVGPASQRLIFLVAFLPAAALGYTLVLMAVIQTVRQLGLVARIHREATAIDPYDTGPVYAFSALTVRAALAYVISGYYTLTFNGAFQEGNVIGLLFLGASLGVGVASFVVPLWGIHERLVREKALLLRDAAHRTSQLAGELYRRVERGEFDTTKNVSDSMAGMAVIRDQINRVPTWPWPPQLFRGFLSALLLPVIVYLVSRILAGRIGA